MNNIGEKIRLFALNKGYSLAELARLLEMKPQSLQSYLSGRSLPGAEILKKLQDLGCDINWLLSDDDKPPPETNELLKAKIKELEEENERLRANIGRLLLIAKEIELEQKKKRPKR